MHLTTGSNGPAFGGAFVEIFSSFVDGLICFETSFLVFSSVMASCGETAADLFCPFESSWPGTRLTLRWLTHFSALVSAVDSPEALLTFGREPAIKVD